MKILIIGDEYLPIPAVEGGAIETLIASFIDYNEVKNYFDITVYSPFSNKINNDVVDKYKNIKFNYIKKSGIKYKIYKYTLAFLRRIFKKKTFPTAYCKLVINSMKNKNELNKYNLIIIENQIQSLIEYRKNIKAKIVDHLHNDYLNVNTKNAKKIVNACDEFWGVSKFIASQINAINPNVVTKVLYNGVDHNKFNNNVAKKQKKEVLKKIGFKEDDYIIIYVGRIMPEKGVLELIKSYNIVKNTINNSKLLIVGEKRNNSKEIKKYLNQLQDETKKNSKSIYFYGKASIEELKILYSISNLQIVPTMCEEAFGLIVVEGIYAGLPVIITNSGGMEEIVNNKTIVINRKTISEDLPEAIIKIYNNKELSKKIIKETTEEAKKFSIENYHEKFKKLIIESLKQNN